MTQPPDEPPGDQPGEQSGDRWQAPGPPPSSPPLPGQNPYGGGTTNYYAVDSGGMSNAAKVTLGVVLGLVGGFVLWFVVAFALLASVPSSSSTTFFFLSAIVPMLVPGALLIWKATRPWAVGLLIGTAVVSIGLAGLCSSLVNGGTA